MGGVRVDLHDRRADVHHQRDVCYFHNSYFRAKMLLLVLAAINVLVFELTDRRTLARWDMAPSSPPLGRAVATISLVIWVAVIVAGRMIGFTTTRASVDDPVPAEVNFDDLLGLPANNTTPPLAK